MGEGKVPANVLEMSQKENSDVGRALSVSHSKFSFPTSVSTVPLSSLSPSRPLYRLSFESTPFPPAISRESSSGSEPRRRYSHDELSLSLRALVSGGGGSRARARAACHVSQHGAAHRLWTRSSESGRSNGG